MISSIDELETWDGARLARLHTVVSLDDVAVALHGVSPALAAAMVRAMPLRLRLRYLVHPARRARHRLDAVEAAHMRIAEAANVLELDVKA